VISIRDVTKRTKLTRAIFPFVGQYSPKVGDVVPEALMCVGYQYSQDGGLEHERRKLIEEKINKGVKAEYPAGAEDTWDDGFYWSGGGNNIIPAYTKGKYPLVIGYNTEAFAKVRYNTEAFAKVQHCSTVALQHHQQRLQHIQCTQGQARHQHVTNMCGSC
jgi:hypothetical protein